MPQWVVIDLGRRSLLRDLHVVFATSAEWRAAVSASDSGSTSQDDQWTALSTVPAGTGFDYHLPLKGTFRFVRLTITAGAPAALDSLSVDATPVADSDRSPLVAPPPPAGEPLAVMQSCDLWSSTAMWKSVLASQPRSQPLRGRYDDADPAVIDARIVQARAAGITAFQSCWFRQKGNAGQPVMTEFDGAIRAFAELARQRDAIRWSLFWDNANPAADGVAGTADFVDHLVPFWVDAYFSRRNYLRLRGRPVLAIASVDRLVGQLGGEHAARGAIDALRAAARAAGVGDPLLLACNNASPEADNALARRIGFDGVMAYASPMFTGLLPDAHPDAAAVLRAEAQAWQARLHHSRLPPIVTASIGYDARPWSGADAFYRLDPAAWQTLLRQSFARARDLPAGEPGHQLLYLDSWNEYGEGHYIEPSVAYGTAALDGLRRVLLDPAVRPPSGHSAR